MKLKGPKHLRRSNGSDADLRASLEKHGQVQKIVARPDGETIIGERRRRILGNSADVVVMDLDDEGALELRLSEDLSKTDIDPIERGEAIRALMALREKRGQSTTLAAIARAIGTTEGTVKYYLGFAKLPAPVKDMVQTGRIDHKVAEKLATPALTPKERTVLAKKVEQGLVPGGMAFEKVVRFATQEAPAEVRKQITERPHTSFDEARRASDRRQAAAERERNADAAAVRVEYFFLTVKRRVREWASGMTAIRNLAPLVPDDLQEDVGRAVRRLRDRCDDFLREMEEGKPLPRREALRVLGRAATTIESA